MLVIIEKTISLFTYNFFDVLPVFFFQNIFADEILITAFVAFFTAKAHIVRPYR